MPKTARIIAAAAALIAAFLPAGAEGQAASANSQTAVTLAQALDEAASSGADLALVERNLGIARLQRSLDLAKQGFSLSASGAYTMSEALGDDSSSARQSLISRAESAAGASLSSNSGLAQSASGSLAFSSPLTKATLSVSQTMPPVTASSSTQSSSLGLTATQTLWDGYLGGQFSATLAKSGLSLQGKELTAVQGRSAAVAKVKQAYVAMLAAQRDFDIKKKTLEKQSRLLAQVQAVYALQQVSAIDLKTAQINARSAEIDVATSDKTLRIANEKLAVIMGRASGERFSVADFEDPSLPAPSIDEAIRIGLEKRVDLAQAGISAKSSRIDASLARAQASPTVSLTGGAGLSVSWTATPLSETALSLGAKVALPILDSGTADFQAKVYEAQASLFDLQAETLKKTLSSDIRDYYESAVLLAEKIDLARQSADLAESQFELVKTQNDYGTATTQDLLAASVTAATAEALYGTARNSYLLAVLNLETAMGL
jgi:outer membrane protein TolC